MRANESTGRPVAHGTDRACGATAAQVQVRPLAWAAMWSLHAYGSREDLARAMSGITGSSVLPDPQRMVQTPGGAWLAWAGPHGLLLIAGPAAALPPFDVARDRLQGTRTVAFDVSDARSAVCIEGAAGVALLAGGCPADVSVEGFRAGSVRATVLGALPCTIARPAERATWWVMVPRSYGTSLRSWLRGPWLDLDVVEAFEAASP